MSINLIQRKKGKCYRVRVMRGGQMYSETFGRLYDAQLYELKVKSDDSLPAETNMKFEQAAKQWLKSNSEINNTPSGFETSKRLLDTNVLPVVGRLKLRKVTVRHVEEIVLALKARDLKNSSIKRTVDVMKALFNYYIKRRTLASNPIEAMQPIKLPDVDCRYWTQGEATQFLEYARQKYAGTKHHGFYLLYKVALHTGMRLGELRGLQWSAVDFQNRQIKVSQSYCGVAKAIRLTTKSGKIRHVPLGDNIYGDLREAYDKRESDLVFHLNGKVLDKSNLRNRHFDKDIKEAGVSKIRIHDMRHTFASHFMMNGGNIYFLQAILGHSSIKMTQRYAHLAKGFLTQSADLVSFTNGKVIHADFGRKEGTNNA